MGPAWGTWLAYGVASPTQQHFGGPLVNFPGTGTKVYLAVLAVLLNLLVAVVLTIVLRALRVDEGTDRTGPLDYHADAGPAGRE